MFVDRSDPAGLIKIPSCVSCNHGSSKFDEQFKWQVSLLIQADTEQKKKFWQSARKTLNHDKNFAKKTNLLIQAQTAPLVILPGIIGHPVSLPSEPVHVVVTKIIRGLYWLVTQKNSPPDFKIDIRLISQDTAPDAYKQMLNKFGSTIQRGNGQFEAIYALIEDCEGASIWLLRFYGRDCFFVISSPKNR